MQGAGTGRHGLSALPREFLAYLALLIVAVASAKRSWLTGLWPGADARRIDQVLFLIASVATFGIALPWFLRDPEPRLTSSAARSGLIRTALTIAVMAAALQLSIVAGLVSPGRGFAALSPVVVLGLLLIAIGEEVLFRESFPALAERYFTGARRTPRNVRGVLWAALVSQSLYAIVHLPQLVAQGVPLLSALTLRLLLTRLAFGLALLLVARFRGTLTDRVAIHLMTNVALLTTRPGSLGAGYATVAFAILGAAAFFVGWKSATRSSGSPAPVRDLRNAPS